MNTYDNNSIADAIAVLTTAVILINAAVQIALLYTV